jgi:hypothetical protein
MNFLRLPVIQIKQDFSENDSLPVHRRKDMEAPTLPGDSKNYCHLWRQ